MKKTSHIVYASNQIEPHAQEGGLTYPNGQVKHCLIKWPCTPLHSHRVC